MRAEQGQVSQAPPQAKALATEQAVIERVAGSACAGAAARHGEP